MRLRNKSTGEIGVPRVNYQELYVDTENGYTYNYKSLQNMYDEWGDYEEPKDYWYMSNKGDIRFIEDENTDWDNERKLIGNYFESREEAEKAVEKLKAVKRLKDRKFKFDGWENDKSRTLGDFVIYASIKCLDEIVDDFNLLFGGEE